MSGAHRGPHPGHADHGSGPRRAARSVGRRRPAVGCLGRPVVRAGQPRRRQRLGRGGLEAVLRGPKLRFGARTVIAVAGAVASASVDGIPLPAGVPHGGRGGPGARPRRRRGARTAPVSRRSRRSRRSACSRQPVDVPARQVRRVRGPGAEEGRSAARGRRLAGPPLDVGPLLPAMSGEWHVRVVPGPHGAPDYLTDQGVEELFGAEWTLDHRSDRTGIRLVGPTPGFARTDGGEAGLHPSNIHDSAYPVGGMMLSAARRSWWVPTGRASAGSSCRQWWCGPTAGCSRRRDQATRTAGAGEPGAGRGRQRGTGATSRWGTGFLGPPRPPPASRTVRCRWRWSTPAGGLPGARRTAGRRPPRPGRGRAATARPHGTAAHAPAGVGHR